MTPPKSNNPFVKVKDKVPNVCASFSAFSKEAKASDLLCGECKCPHLNTVNEFISTRLFLLLDPEEKNPDDFAS